MSTEKGLANVAYSKQYLKQKSEIISNSLQEEYKKKETVHQEGNYRRVVTEYRNDNYYCSKNQVYDSSNTLIHEYISTYHHSFFCTSIKHKNGKEYLFYKENLYGYSVFEIESKKTFQYIPYRSFNGKETFIATDVYYNENNNIFAIEGCYWACPVDTILVEINNPLEQFSKYLALHELLDKDYEKYDDICFVNWHGTDLELKCYNIEIEPYKNEFINITEQSYLSSLTNKDI